LEIDRELDLLGDTSSASQSLSITDAGEVKEWLDLKTAEKRYLSELMAFHHDDKEQVAKVAGISLRSLYRKLE
jgi:transcriptional regulator with PAS, ATPase and Fis domain